jgi:hypothetical protein
MRPSLLSLDFSKFARCPSCASGDVSFRYKLDWADPLYSSLSRFLLFWRDYKLYFCRPCRLQFYDSRLTRKAARAISVYESQEPAGSTLLHLFSDREPLLQSRVKTIGIRR